MAGNTVDAAAFVLDSPAQLLAVWGTGQEHLWTVGEPLYIVAPPGVGKTTLAQNLALRRHGALDDQALLGLPIAVDPRAVLYLAADRPAQAARSFRRMVGERERRALEFMRVHRGPPPCGDVARNPDGFAEWVLGLDVGTVFIDSLKDIALGLSEDGPGAAVNMALQRIVGEGVEVCVCHHQRKASGDNRQPRTLDDVYGSRWLTAGAGSVVLLWGEAGDPIVDVRHLKQPAEEVGPLTLAHDHPTGNVTVHRAPDLLELATEPISAPDAARAVYGKATPAQVEKVRRRLEALVGRGEVEKLPGAPRDPTRYVTREGVSRG